MPSKDAIPEYSDCALSLRDELVCGGDFQPRAMSTLVIHCIILSD